MGRNPAPLFTDLGPSASVYETTAKDDQISRLALERNAFELERNELAAAIEEYRTILEDAEKEDRTTLNATTACTIWEGAALAVLRRIQFTNPDIILDDHDAELLAPVQHERDALVAHIKSSLTPDVDIPKTIKDIVDTYNKNLIETGIHCPVCNSHNVKINKIPHVFQYDKAVIEYDCPTFQCQRCGQDGNYTEPENAKQAAIIKHLEVVITNYKCSSVLPIWWLRHCKHVLFGVRYHTHLICPYCQK